MKVQSLECSAWLIILHEIKHAINETITAVESLLELDRTRPMDGQGKISISCHCQIHKQKQRPDPESEQSNCSMSHIYDS